MSQQILFRGDTAANWSSVNPILAQREMGLDLTNNKFKIGDGATAWNSLPYSATAIGDIIGVSIDSPAVDQILKYNGSAWVNGSASTVNAGAGVNYFLTASASGIGGYELMSKTPDSASEVDENVVVNNNTVLIGSYIADAAVGSTQLDAGIWTFNLFSYVSVNSGDTRLTVDVYKRTSGGVETLLFSDSTDTINTTVVQQYTTESVQPAYSVNATDKVVFKISATTTAVVNVTTHLVHSGTTHYSHAHTPLVTRHNDLSGLNGGTSDEYYHLTSAEYTGSGTGVFLRTNAPNITNPTGITKANVGLSNVDNTADTAKAIAGDVTGTLGASTVAKLQNRTLLSTAPKHGQVITWDAGASNWVPKSFLTTSQAAANSTLSLTVNSNDTQVFTGAVVGQIAKMPDATTLDNGRTFTLVNLSDSFIIVQNNAGTLLSLLYPTKELSCRVVDVSSAAGVWSSVDHDLDGSIMRMSDTFITGSTASLSIGTLGWTLTTGTVASQAVTGALKGVIRLASTAANNSFGALSLGTTTPILLGTSRHVVEMNVSMPSIGATGAGQLTGYAGLGDGIAVGENTNGVYFKYVGTTGTTTNWQCVTSNGGTRTTVDSGVAVNAGQFYKLSLVTNANGTSVSYYINNAFVATITTNIPTTNPIAPNMKISAGGTNAAAKNFDIDYFNLTVIS